MAAKIETHLTEMSLELRAMDEGGASVPVLVRFNWDSLTVELLAEDARSAITLEVVLAGGALELIERRMGQDGVVMQRRSLRVLEGNDGKGKDVEGSSGAVGYAPSAA